MPAFAKASAGKTGRRAQALQAVALAKAWRRAQSKGHRARDTVTPD